MEVAYKTRFWCTCGNRYFDEKVFHRKSIERQCGKGRIGSYIQESIIYCCDQMKESFDDRLIIFGPYEYGVDSNVNIIDCKAWPEGASYSENPIKFCPFCGDEIITKNIGEV